VKNSVIIGLILFGSLSAQLVFGQGFETPIITQQHRQISQKANSQGITENNTPLSLPFWDDFSQSRDYPDTLRWENSYDVQISPTVGINTLSFNAAVFNGIDSSGVAHSSAAFQEGETDILTSCAIDLSTYDASSDIYLSFFYQKKGHGEIPNDNDGIRVELMNSDSIWVSNILQANGDDVQILGEEVVEVDTFFQVLVPVLDPQFFSDKFRFRFVATGRQTGILDTWLIDYVYLNDKRSSADDRYPDRAFTRPLSAAFKNYYSIPIAHFMTAPESYLGTVGNQFKNLGGKNALGNDETNFDYEVNFTIDYTAQDDVVHTTDNQQLITPAENNDDINGLKPLKRKDFTVDSLVKITDLPIDAKRAAFNYQMVLTLGDTISVNHRNIDFRANDTIRSTFILDDYYAYDDGSAERGAGVNNVESQMAYKFGLPSGYTDDISGVDIYFPKTVENTQFGKQVTLKVWPNNNGLPGTEIFSQDILIQKIDTLNQFYRYEFSHVVEVTDTFYIGWEQLTSDRIYVGLDKNTDNRDRIFFNITGDWEVNSNDIIGSLMVRPVFGELPPVDPDLVTSLNNNTLASAIHIYPNPSTGMLYIDGDYDEITIRSLSGRRLTTAMSKDGTHTEVNMVGLPSGMYIVSLQKDNIIINKKIILNQ
jgi:hypothetical protein